LAGAPELGNLCLLHDGSERKDIFVSDLARLTVETASEGQSRDAVGEYKRVNGC
jgi:hypothetical protein